MPPTAQDKETQLIAFLHHWNVKYLLGWEDTSVIFTNTDEENIAFLQQLAACSNTRLRDATISLLLLHPEVFSPIMCLALENSPSHIAEQLSILTLAALYLQRFWSFRLGRVLGQTNRVSEDAFSFLWMQRRLPPPGAYDGDWGLRALEQYEQERHGLPILYRGDWQNQIDHLLRQEEQRQRPPLSLSLLETTTDEVVCSEERVDQHLRPRIDQKAIDTFLTTLDHSLLDTGAIYLSGETALLYTQTRTQPIYDIHLGILDGEIAPCIREVEESLHIPVSFVHPAFMLPPEWQNKHQFLRDYGKLQVFSLDPLSIALSKVLRASTSDIRDLILMKQQKRISEQALDHAVTTISQLGEHRQGLAFEPELLLARYNDIKLYVFFW